MEKMDVSIIIPLHKPNKEILSKIEDSLKKQDFKGKIEIIRIQEGLGLAASLNTGIKKAKNKIVISLHQDCIPSSNNWLTNLVEPLKRKEVVATVSKVELPFGFWKNFGFMARVMSIKEQETLTPLLDEKGCAYKIEALKKVGLFNELKYKTAGEDFDMYLKLKKVGKIEYPGAKIIHLHIHTFKNRFRKEFQLSEGFGALVRTYGNEMPRWYVGLIKAIPLLGWPLFIVNFPYSRWILGGMTWVPLSLMVHLIYVFGFWKGFFNKKQVFGGK